jgi:hypothetical protein
MESAQGEVFSPLLVGQIFLLGLEEIVGSKGVTRVLQIMGDDNIINEYQGNNLKLKLSWQELGGILNAIERIYGQRAGRGVLVRTGHTCFKYGLREFGDALGVTELTFRLKPLSRKIGEFLYALTRLDMQLQGEHIQIEESNYHWLFKVTLLKNTEMGPGVLLSYMVVGFFQEAMYWISGGKPPNVELLETGENPAVAFTLAIYKNK